MVQIGQVFTQSDVPDFAHLKKKQNKKRVKRGTSDCVKTHINILRKVLICGIIKLIKQLKK